MTDLDALRRDLVMANHILAREGVTDALGHVSVRRPDRPDRFFLSCSRSPELVKLDDIMEYDLECDPIDQRGRPMYFERPIHGAIYQARPDVISIVHNHAYEVIPFGLTRKPLKPCVHPACGMGTHVPVWDSRASFGDTDLLITDMQRGREFSLAAWATAIACSCAVTAVSSLAPLSSRLSSMRFISRSMRVRAAHHADRRRHHLSQRRRDRADEETRLCRQLGDPHVGLLVAPMRRQGMSSDMNSGVAQTGVLG